MLEVRADTHSPGLAVCSLSPGFEAQRFSVSEPPPANGMRPTKRGLMEIALTRSSATKYADPLAIGAALQLPKCPTIRSFQT